MKVFLADFDVTIFIPQDYVLCGDSLIKREIKFIKKEFVQTDK